VACQGKLLYSLQKVRSDATLLRGSREVFLSEKGKDKRLECRIRGGVGALLVPGGSSFEVDGLNVHSQEDVCVIFVHGFSVRFRGIEPLSLNYMRFHEDDMVQLERMGAVPATGDGFLLAIARGDPLVIGRGFWREMGVVTDGRSRVDADGESCQEGSDSCGTELRYRIGPTSLSLGGVTATLFDVKVGRLDFGCFSLWAGEHVVLEHFHDAVPVRVRDGVQVYVESMVDSALFESVRRDDAYYVSLNLLYRVLAGRRA